MPRPPTRRTRTSQKTIIPSAASGGTTIATAEALNSDPKHVDAAGNPVTAVPFITQAGLSIPAALQTAAGRNLLIAFRRNR